MGHLHTSDLDVERLRRVVVGHEINAGAVAHRPHVGGQVSVVLGEEVLFGLAQVGFHIFAGKTFFFFTSVTINCRYQRILKGEVSLYH